MAGVGPAAERVGTHAIAALASGRHVDRVLAYVEVAVRILQVAPHAVQVDRVGHHRVVDQHDAQALAVVEAQRSRVGELLAVERPGEALHVAGQVQRSEEHTSELQSLMRISYAVFCLKKKKVNIK